MTPLLSIVLTGRNDEYGIDFRTRFLRTLAFNHRELSARGIPFEIVFVEWAPDPARPLLIELALAAVSHPSSASALRGIVVDRQYQEALSLNARLEYLEFIAKNVGIRRARGEYVLTANGDVFLSRQVLDVFERSVLEPRVVYRACRHDLKMSLEASRIDWEMLEDQRNLERVPRPLRPPLMGGGTGDFILLDRATWHTIGGFNEIYRVARIGIDQNFIVKALSSGLEIRDIGGPIYHVNHPGSYRLTRDTYKGREDEAHYGNINWHSQGVIYVNPPTWGLQKAPERVLTPTVTALDFAWDAVHPLVDLRRIVLPVARVGAPYPGSYTERSLH